MAPKKKKQEKGDGEEEDPLATLQEQYFSDQQKWGLEREGLNQKLLLTSQELKQCEAENRELKQDLERKNEKELNMFEYLSGVVRKRDVEISDLRQESVEVRDNLTHHRDELRNRLEAMREQELEQRKKIRGLESQADEVYNLRQENTRLSDECAMLRDMLEKTATKLAVMEDRVAGSEQLMSLMRVVNDDEQCGLAPVITGAMFERHQSALIQAEACAALEGIMSRSTAITPRASDPWWIDSVHPVLKGMENFPYFSPVQTNACDVLWKLCLQDGNFHDIILKKGGLTRILTAMQNHKDDARLVYSACGALRKLLACRKAESGVDAALTPRLKQDDSGAAMGVHAADLVVKTMQVHKDNANVVEVSANALAELSTRGEEIKRAVVGARTVETLFEAMQNHRSVGTLRRAGLKFFLAMLENRPPPIQRALQSEIAAKEKETGLIQETVDQQRKNFTDKEILVLEKVVEKASTMLGVKEEDDDDNADADVSWIHKKL